MAILSIRQPSRTDDGSQPAPSPLPPTLTPNLLPCHIHHDGPVSADERYWRPVTSAAAEGAGAAGAGEGTSKAGEQQTAYFRGRKLQGRKVGVPGGYRGAILQLPSPTTTTTNTSTTSTSLQRTHANASGDEDDEEADEEEEEVETKEAQELARFDHLVVWTHDAAAVDATEDPYVRGVEEWVRFAGAMHEVVEG